MTYSPAELVCVCRDWNQNEDPHETWQASIFPPIGSHKMASYWSFLGASCIPQDISHIYIKILWHNPEFLTHKIGKSFKRKAVKVMKHHLLNEGIREYLFLLHEWHYPSTVFEIWAVSSVLNTGCDNIRLTPIIITILTITIRPGLDSNKAQFMTN